MRTRFRVVALLAWILVALAAEARAQADFQTVEAAISTIRALDRSGRDNLATVWDGNKYIQCRGMSGGPLRCEAAGTLMQPSLERVLTPECIGRLATMGWQLDPSFGNYVQTFGPEISSPEIAGKILDTLFQGYDADTRNLEIETTTIRSEPCPPRNGPSQNLAGMINDAPSMREVSIHACAYKPADAGPAQKLGPNSTVADLIQLYGPKVTVEFQRLRVNIHRRAYAVFDVDLGYVQCETQQEPDGFYCEAQSADSWPALAAVLTEPRVARLHALGFADPGRAPNYSKTYLASETKDSDLASEVLTVLHDVYGYYGATKLAVKTEEDKGQ